MKVKARLTNPQLSRAEEYDFLNDTDFRILETLFPNDPLIAADEKGYFLSATEIDDADSGGSASLRDTCDRLMTRINGSASLLTSGSFVAAELTYDFEGSTPRQPRSRILHISGRGISVGAVFDVESANRVGQLAASNPWVMRVLELLSHLKYPWIWIDLWRIWDILQGYYGKRNATGWAAGIVGQGDIDNFKRSANDPDPSISGTLARHSGVGYVPRVRDGVVVGSKVLPDEGIEIIKTLVAAWLSDLAGTPIQRQH